MPGKAATRAQSYSRQSGCMSTEHLHCLSNCLIESKHNLLSTSLQLKCIKLVEGHLHSKYVIQQETLCWNMVLTQICFSYLQISFTFFVVYSFTFFSHFFLLGTLSLQERVPTNPFLPGPETYLYQCFKSLATMRNIYISKFVLASKHGCP